MNFKICLFLFSLFLLSCKSDIDCAKAKIRESNIQILKNENVRLYLDDIQKSDVKEFKNLDYISLQIQSNLFTYITRWEKDSLKTINWKLTKFDQIYTDKFVKWNPSDVDFIDKPVASKLIKKIIYTDNNITIIYKTGGLVISDWITNYQIEKEQIITHWTIQNNVNSLFGLVDLLLTDNYELYK